MHIDIHIHAITIIRKNKAMHLMKSNERYRGAFEGRKGMKDMLQLNHNLKMIEMIWK